MKHNGKIYLVFILAFILVLLMGCSGASSEDEMKLAYISKVENSSYAKTFEDLSLGIVYDFQLKVTEADTSWVTLWVEGYQNGEKTSPFRLIDLSYGLHPTDKVTEGSMGFGIINPTSKENVSFFLYSDGISAQPRRVENILNRFDAPGDGATTWDYAIGDDEVGLQSGETKVLAVYRQTGQTIRMYDYQDVNQIEQMISEDKTVLLLKISVEKKGN